MDWTFWRQLRGIRFYYSFSPIFVYIVYGYPPTADLDIWLGFVSNIFSMQRTCDALSCMDVFAIGRHMEL